ncbi:MAG: hypothetical protein GY832_11555 [Chloroflexi bacterium]|nr:hypothetical protein [Chloroflexota bacterium]
MTVSSNTQIDTGTTGTGAAQTISFTFPVLAAAEVKAVTQNPTTGAIVALTKDTHYTVSLTGTGTPNYTGGSVTTLTPFVASSLNVYLYRDTTDTQVYDPINNDDMDAEALEQAIDKLFMLVADLQEQVGRCIKVPIPESTTVEVDDLIARASTTLGFDASGNVTTT